VYNVRSVQTLRSAIGCLHRRQTAVQVQTPFLGPVNAKSHLNFARG